MNDAQHEPTLPLADFADASGQKTKEAEFRLICNEFATACRTKQKPSIEDYLGKVTVSKRGLMLKELIKSEIDILEHREQTVALNDYLARFPQHAQSIREIFSQSDHSATTIDHVRRRLPSGLHVRCPHCQNPIELLPDAMLASINCTSCGSNFSLTDDDSLTRDARGITEVAHFKLTERLGMGGFGTVWKAHDSKLDRTVAIKIPRSSQLNQFQQDLFFREARSAAQLRHPNIVPVYEVGRDGSTLYIVSEFVRGVPLSDRLTADPLTAREAAEICKTISVALHHAHEQGIVHRDLKPANVMLDNHGEPHLMDFGLARRDANEITMTMEGQVLGTPAYMSPEQAQGEGHSADRRSDIYSMGVILFHLLTGELPFRGNSRMLIHQVINDDPPTPRKLNNSISRDLETLVMKCMEKNPSRRFGTAEELAAELDRFVQGKPILSRPISRVERIWRWTKRNQRVAVLLSAVVLSLALGTVLSTYSYLRAEAQRQVAEEALQRNEKLSKAEVAARKEAEMRFLQARKTVDSWLTGYTEALQVIPGTHAVRQRMLELAAEEYEIFVSERVRDPAIQLEQSRTLVRLASIYRLLGKPNDAIEKLKQAREGLIAFQGDPKIQIEASLSIGQLYGTLASTYADLGQFDLAQSSFGEGISKLKALQRENKKNIEIQSALVRLLTNQGGVLALVDDLDGAVSAITEAIRICESAEISGDGNFELGLSRAAAELVAGQLKLKNGDANAAQKQFVSAASLYERALDREPLNQTYLLQAIQADQLLAIAFRQLGAADQEQRVYSRIIKNVTSLTESQPLVPGYRESLASVQVDLGQLLLEQLEVSDAERVLGDAIEALTKLKSEFPSTPRYQEELAVSLDTLAQALTYSGRYKEARGISTRAVHELEELVAMWPDVAPYLERLAVSLSTQGLIGTHLEEPATAKKLFQNAIDALAKADRLEKSTPARRQIAASIYERFGTSLIDTDGRLAGRLLRQSRDAWESVLDATNDPAYSIPAARFLLTCPLEELRDSARGARLAGSAVVNSQGNLQACMLKCIGLVVTELEGEALELAEQQLASDRAGAPGMNFVKAIALHRMGKSEQALQAWEVASRWMAEEMPGSPEIDSLRVLAAEELGSAKEL